MPKQSKHSVTPSMNFSVSLVGLSKTWRSVSNTNLALTVNGIHMYRVTKRSEVYVHVYCIHGNLHSTRSLLRGMTMSGILSSSSRIDFRCSVKRIRTSFSPGVYSFTLPGNICLLTALLPLFHSSPVLYCTTHTSKYVIYIVYVYDYISFYLVSDLPPNLIPQIKEDIW